jgi:hypothetical protein
VPPGSFLISDPSLVAWSPGRLDVFAIGNGGNLVHKWYPAGSSWADWENQGRPAPSVTLTARPTSESWEPGRLDVFNRDSSGHARHNWWPGWGLWEDRGTP